MIDDIRHLPAYAARLQAKGITTSLRRSVASGLWRIVSFNNLQAGTLIGSKSAT